jgi:hypothetical protein
VGTVPGREKGGEQVLNRGEGTDSAKQIQTWDYNFMHDFTGRLRGRSCDRN